MAYHPSNNASYLTRTTGLLPVASGDATVSFWFKPTNTTPSGTYRTYYVMLDNPAVYNDYIFIGSDPNTLNVSLVVSIGGVFVQSTKVATTLNTWYYATYVKFGTLHQFYINGALISNLTKNISTGTFAHELLTNDSSGTGTWADQSAAYMREWTSALSSSDIFHELSAQSAFLTTNLYMDCPLASDVLDTSGLHHDWTVVGTDSFPASPDLPSNYSPATATAFGALPETITQTFGQGQSAWYAYTGTNAQTIFGAWAFSVITDSIRLTIYNDPSDLSSPYLSLQTTNKPMQVPIAEGTTLYLLVESLSGSPPTAAVAVSLLPGPTTAIPAGAILTLDDNTGFPASVVSATNGTSYQALQYVVLPPGGVNENGGDILSSGNFLIADDENANFGLYDGSSFARLVTVAGIPESTSSLVRTCVGAQVFYLGNPNISSHAKVYRVTAAGVLTQTWTLTTTGLTGVAASNDETIIYVTGQTTSLAAPIKQWNPNTSSFGADLVAGVANYNTLDLLVLGDNSVLGLYHQNNAPFTGLFVRRYNAAGATLNTYSLGATTNTFHSLFHAIDDPTSFWVRTHDIVTAGTCTLYNIKASDGSILSTVQEATFDSGIYSPSASASPLARFGMALSCPSFVLRVGVTPPNPVGTPSQYPIRWVRRLPHLSVSQVRQFFSMAQLDAEVGVGLLNEPEPIVFLRWSDDGGHSWSSPEPLSMGPLGEYKRRVIWWQLGEARDRVFEISGTDPTVVALINLYLDAKPGVH